MIKFMYHMLTRRAYYITGTFLTKDGTRMFCKTVLLTSMGRLPLDQVQEQLTKKFDGLPVVILWFSRLPWKEYKRMSQNKEHIEFSIEQPR